MMRVEINNTAEQQAINSEIHEFIMGYTVDPKLIDSSLQLWVGDIPNYSNSLDDAFQVVEKIRLTGRIFSIINTVEGEWNVSILQWSEESNIWEAIINLCDARLPFAICVAALEIIAKTESGE